MQWEVTLTNGMILKQGDLPYVELTKYYDAMESCRLTDDDILIVALALGDDKRMFYRNRKSLNLGIDKTTEEWLIGWQQSRPSGVAYTICEVSEDYAVTVTSAFTEANMIEPMEAELEAGFIHPRSAA